MKNKQPLLILLILALMLFGRFGFVQAQTPTPQAGTTSSGDQVVIANTYRLPEGQTLDGNLALIGSTAIIEQGATINRGVAVIGGTVSIAGTVNGDILAIGGAVNLEDTALVAGNISVVGATINRSPLAKVNGRITEQSPANLDLRFSDQAVQPATPQNEPLAREVRAALISILMAVIAVVAALLLTKPIQRVGSAFIDQPAISAGVGLLVVIGFPVVLVLMIITILLIPLAALAVVALGVVLLYGWISIGYELGSKLAEMMHGTWSPAVEAGIGVFLLTLVAAFASLVPYVGWIIAFLLILFSIGSTVMARFGSSKAQPSAIKAGQPVPPPGDQPAD